MGSKTLVEAIDKNTASTQASMESLIAALNAMQGSVGPLGPGNYYYQAIANGPVEQVLAFNNDEHIHLVQETDGSLHFSSVGTLTDLQHNPIADSAVETTFPVDPSQLPYTTKWPPPQTPPWTAPPLDNTNTTENGYSKQAYFFDNRANYLVTVGPSLPKIATISHGGAQFWVSSIGVISQGVGKFRGAHGMSVYTGSAYLPKWPTNVDEQVQILKAGFNARIGTYFKFVLP
jgi:hypothetical protein